MEKTMGHYFGLLPGQDKKDGQVFFWTGGKGSEHDDNLFFAPGVKQGYKPDELEMISSSFIDIIKDIGLGPVESGVEWLSSSNGEGRAPGYYFAVIPACAGGEIFIFWNGNGFQVQGSDCLVDPDELLFIDINPDDISRFAVDLVPGRDWLNTITVTDTDED